MRWQHLDGRYGSKSSHAVARGEIVGMTTNNHIKSPVSSSTRAKVLGQDLQESVASESREATFTNLPAGLVLIGPCCTSA